ncbi:MAG TPA: Crp/Fnr family transcriptional regulator, partial [Leptolyngbyaceae cyanobacterium M65_K2018_010]|nr:Crp/Fnr family transcriptional regulator [Leptolyngbyaceae cyanobacterium M65_K2018_010]
MQPEAFIERFPLFSAASPETLEWILSVTTHHDYPANRAVVMEDAWGNAVYFIEAGWVKVRRHMDESFVTLAVLGQGDFFGEMAILDESPRSTDVVAMTAVKLLSISAQRFIQTLFKDPQLHHRLLQVMVQRLRQTNLRLQLRQQPPAVKLANTLTTLQEAYGQSTEAGVELLNLSTQDLADLSDITADE